MNSVSRKKNDWWCEEMVIRLSHYVTQSSNSIHEFVAKGVKFWIWCMWLYATGPLADVSKSMICWHTSLNTSTVGDSKETLSWINREGRNEKGRIPGLKRSIQCYSLASDLLQVSKWEPWTAQASKQWGFDLLHLLYPTTRRPTFRHPKWRKLSALHQYRADSKVFWLAYSNCELECKLFSSGIINFRRGRGNFINTLEVILKIQTR